MFLIRINGLLMNSLKEQICGQGFHFSNFSRKDRTFSFTLETKIFRRGSRHKRNRKDHAIYKWIQTVRRNSHHSARVFIESIIFLIISIDYRSRYLLRTCTDFYKFQCTMESSLTDLRDNPSVDGKYFEQITQNGH